jgi:hypothetical protein
MTAFSVWAQFPSSLLGMRTAQPGMKNPQVVNDYLVLTYKLVA